MKKCDNCGREIEGVYFDVYETRRGRLKMTKDGLVDNKHLCPECKEKSGKKWWQFWIK
jgi:hypothetical protein